MGGCSITLMGFGRPPTVNFVTHAIFSLISIALLILLGQIRHSRHLLARLDCTAHLDPRRAPRWSTHVQWLPHGRALRALRHQHLVQPA